MRILLSFIVVLLFSSCKTATSPAFIEATNEYRKEYVRKFKTNPHSPLLAEDLKNLDFFPPNEIWACECDITLLNEAVPVVIKTYSQKEKSFQKFAKAACTAGNTSFDIYLYQNTRQISMPIFRDQLFLPFMDHTNGEETYGGGRYIDLSTKNIKDGKLTIDFNMCYNPYCAYGDGWNCPIPPVENHLDFAVPAGEKMYKGVKRTRPSH